MQLPPLTKLPKKMKEKKAPFEARYDKEMRELMQDRTPEVVFLNIFNVHSSNCFLELFGFGLYHTSVQLHNCEFSYGGHDEACSGLVIVEAGKSAGLTLKEKIPVGITYYTDEEIY